MSDLICDALSGVGFRPGFCKEEAEEAIVSRTEPQTEDPEARSFLENLLWGTRMPGAVGCAKREEEINKEINLNLQKLKSEDREIQKEAIKKLIDIGGPAIDALITTVKQANIETRRLVIYLLGEWGQAKPSLERTFWGVKVAEEAPRILRELINDPEPSIRVEAATAWFLKIGDENMTFAGFRFGLPLQNHEDENLRLIGLEAFEIRASDPDGSPLGTYPMGGALNALAGIIEKDPSQNVRRKAAFVFRNVVAANIRKPWFSMLGPGKTAFTLSSIMINNPDAYIRGQAVETFEILGTKDAVQVLEEHLKIETDVVLSSRIQAVIAKLKD